VVVGDLNADPEEENLFRQAVRDLVGHERVHPDATPTATPTAQAAYPDLEPDETALWGKRVDYVLPSTNLVLDTSGVWRPVPRDTAAVPVSDHFPVWVDVRPPSSR
jgi:endonuclease/exonuclease/phosphatase family metal-dependent hydrolase